MLLPPCDNATVDWMKDDLGTRQLANDVEGAMMNLTCLPHAPKLTNGAYLKAIVLGVMAVLSLIANAATIWSIRKNRRKRHGCSAIYILILHLSVADLLVTVFCIGGEAVWSYTVAWILDNVTCKIFKFLQMFSLYLSTFVLVLIGVDRFVAVRYPMKSLNTAQRCNRLVIYTWILSFILSIPQVSRTQSHCKKSISNFFVPFLIFYRIRIFFIHLPNWNGFKKKINQLIKPGIYNFNFK